MMDYLNAKRQRRKSPAPPSKDTAIEEDLPVLTEEDEAFLHRIATEGTPPELPERPGTSFPTRPQDLREAGNSSGNDTQIALMNGAQNIPIPDTPDTPEEVLSSAGNEPTEKGVIKEATKKSKWSWFRRDSRDAKRQRTATDLMSAAEGLKSPYAQPNEDGQVSDPEAKREEEEMRDVLDELNLAAVNNRVFSISKESQELLHKFTLVLKDLVNGAPTAYGDLESLLTNSEGQLQQGYAKLPPWLQKLIEQLPSKMTKSIGPEMLLAAAEKPGVNAKFANMAAHGAEKAGLRVRVPSLQDLVTKPGAVIGLLKAIMNFLKLRFPAFLGLNVLYSLALFILLFVFWYCHKRGREVRLEKERLLTEEEILRLNDDATATNSGTPPTTTASVGAPIADVQQGMRPINDTGTVGTEGTRTTYSEGGSLAQYEREKDQAKKAAIKVTEVEDEINAKPNHILQDHETREQFLRKRAKQAARWRMQPSAAPLDSQESCILS